jgi:hypothetical protein
MGMIGYFAAVNQDDLDRLRDDPGLIEEYLYPNDGGDGPPYYVDVDKAWHGIHFMLTGKPEGGAEPLSLAVLGGEEVGDDMGYGPARFLTPEQVRRVAAALEKLSIDEFASRYAPKEMEAAKVYPEVIWLRDEQEALNYVLEKYQQMIAFYQDAAARGDGAILWLT